MYSIAWLKQCICRMTAHSIPSTTSKNGSPDEEIITYRQSCSCTRHECIWGSGIILHAFLTGWGITAALQPIRSTPGTHWLGGCIRPRAGLKASKKRKICLCRNLNNESSAIRPVANHYTHRVHWNNDNSNYYCYYYSIVGQFWLTICYQISGYSGFALALLYYFFPAIFVSFCLFSVLYLWRCVLFVPFELNSIKLNCNCY
jgi:hypothetical protein